jgi:hypothetical protein
LIKKIKQLVLLTPLNYQWISTECKDNTLLLSRNGVVSNSKCGTRIVYNS